MLRGIIDTHAHYDDGRFSADRDELISSLRENGVCGVINIGCDIKTSEAAIKLAKKYDFFYSSVGVHPHYADIIENNPDFIKRLKYIINENSDLVVAIGEIGLDYFYDNSPVELQKRMFQELLGLAEELKLPAIIHSREAANDTIEILKNHKKLRGVLHCYGYGPEEAEIFVNMGYYIGFTGMVTFNKAKKTAEAANAVPLDRILLETDCPYMAPVPFRGKRSDSMMIAYTAEKIAQIKGIPVQELIDIARENANNLFKLNI